jgi:hypothetical protein
MLGYRIILCSAWFPLLVLLRVRTCTNSTNYFLNLCAELSSLPCHSRWLARSGRAVNYCRVGISQLHYFATPESLLISWWSCLSRNVTRLIRLVISIHKRWSSLPSSLCPHPLWLHLRQGVSSALLVVASATKTPIIMPSAPRGARGLRSRFNLFQN